MGSRQDIENLLEKHNINEQEKAENNFESWVGVNCEIHPNDEIFQFIFNHPTSTNPLRDYLSDGWRTSYELMIILEEVGRSLVRCTSFLEFASGYGRLTRHLAKFPGAGKVSVSDVMPGAIEFCQQRFGVSGFPSSPEPEKVAFPQQYEVVFVLSLFSHLPKSTWSQWLLALYGAVAPGGCLIFTTHGESVATQSGVELDNQGFFFVPSSESDHLANEQYGTTITSVDFVEREISRLPDAASLLFKRDHFWAGQDAWIVGKPATK